jgi:hypothetical protein
MAIFVKRAHSEKTDQEEYYHWHTDCPDYPRRRMETILIFKKKRARPCVREFIDK